MRFLARRRADRRRRRADGERGAALVETALVALPLLTMSLGLVEFGRMWSDSMALDRASRSAARVAAQLGDDPRSDREALRSLVSNIDGQDRVEVEYVIIFEVGTGGMAPACETGSQSTCNHYTAAQLADLDLDSHWECGGVAHDGSWCPTTREAELHAPIDLGVKIVAKRAAVTGLFSDEFDLSTTTIFRLNPIHR